MRAKSANALDALQIKKGNREWVREVRKEHPPFSNEEYLHDWELFFDQFAYGETNISRFTHGWLLLQMSAQAATKLLFIA